jgi:hypothetical protein
MKIVSPERHNEKELKSSMKTFLKIISLVCQPSRTSHRLIGYIGARLEKFKTRMSRDLPLGTVLTAIFPGELLLAICL